MSIAPCEDEVGTVDGNWKSKKILDCTQIGKKDTSKKLRRGVSLTTSEELTMIRVPTSLKALSDRSEGLARATDPTAIKS
jgi:hypothetical protein